ncbi:RHS repeat-associated core domain-containing protein [Delftia acidovorans]|uniref:RHS repeat-associated core domain-containing protein n=1 Tax=Delftia acidovorans TaxID=80866 RepID=A0AAJ2R3A5_DELAC|nr:RHS repeat-associated core domain-containing protein [Delftia acidovorans]MDX4956363.1 RHS repeat-associated core domain-containing protein [Delftia acidovorans]
MKFDLRYPGQVFDEETGLSYNLHRYYDAATGRYIQADPIGLEGGWNRFGYVANNPLNDVDPQGLHPVLARMQGLYYRYGPAITEFIAGASGVNGALASPAAISPLVAQIPTGVSRMLPIARGISEGVESGAFCTTNSVRKISFSNGFYEAAGSPFKFSEYYYHKLWSTGRGAPFLQAEEILSTATSISPDRMNGFYKYLNGNLEMVYNPNSKEVWHLMPVR